MLDKIFKISQSPDFKQSLSASRKTAKLFSSSGNDKTNPADSFTFSPVLEYLKKVNWNIKGLKKESPEKLLLSFNAYDLEFQVSLGIKESSVLKEINYLIEYHKNSVEQNYQVSFSIEFSREKEFSHYENVPAIKKLFKRLEDLKLTSAVTSEDSFFLNELLSGVGDDIFKELNYISNVVIQALEVLFQQKYLFTDPTENKRFISLDFIKPL